MIKLYELLFILFFIFQGNFTLFSQDCKTPQSIKTLEGNNISAIISANGHLFWDLQGGGFLAPNDQYQQVSSIFAAGLFIGAQDSQGNKKVSASSYQSGNSFLPGPINGTPEDCHNFDRLWEVFGYEIQQHIYDFEDNGIIDHPISNIYSYPANQNPFFEDFHGFSLPSFSQGLAPFYDNNGDGIYNPDDGDFPLPESVDKTNIPVHIIWGLFNDTNPSSSTEPLNIEIQITAWSLYCSDNELLNNTIFTSHKITNKSNENLDSMFIGLWMDMDLGCFTDDYLGCNPDLNTFYGYNQDSVDGTTGCQCSGGSLTYCDVVPTQAITFLNKDFSSFIPWSFDDCHAAPTNTDEYYNLMNGLYSNGDPMTIGGNGCQGTESTKFAFPDNPNNPQGWSMHTSLNEPFFDFRSLANTFIGSLPPDGSTTLDIGYSFNQDENLNHLEIVDEMYNQIPTLQQQYDNRFQNDCLPIICVEDCVWPGDANRDSIVNYCDIFQIALANGSVGEPKNNLWVWQPFEGQNWDSTIYDIDLKHTDCSGNGIINGEDTDLVSMMYGNSYKTDPLPPDEYPYGNELSLLPKNDSHLDSIEGGKFMRLQINLNQEEAIYGLTFTMEFDTQFFEYNGIELVNNPFQTNSSTLVKSIKDEANGEFIFVAVNFNHENILTKTGSFAEVWLNAKTTSYASAQSLIRLKNIKAILSDGTELDYGANDFVTTIFNFDGTGILLNNEDFEKEKIEIFPNPTTHLLNVKLQNSSDVEFSIFDIYGKQVFYKKENGTQESALSVKHLSNGIYFLKIKKDGKEFIHKFIKL